VGGKTKRPGRGWERNGAGEAAGEAGEAKKEIIDKNVLAASSRREWALMSFTTGHRYIPCLGKHGVAQLVTEGGPCPRHAVADNQRWGRQRQHARHGGRGEGCGVSRQAVYGVFQQEGNLQRPGAGQGSGSGDGSSGGKKGSSSGRKRGACA
jgi:hypothetical protein